MKPRTFSQIIDTTYAIPRGVTKAEDDARTMDVSFIEYARVDARLWRGESRKTHTRVRIGGRLIYTVPPEEIRLHNVRLVVRDWPTDNA